MAPITFFPFSGKSSKRGSGPLSLSGSGQDDMLRINNSTTDFTSSNNFTRSGGGNDYTQHLPPHLKLPPSPHKPKIPPSSPEGAAAAASSSSSCEDPAPEKKLATPSPPPTKLDEESPPTSCSSGYKSQGSIFTFHPSSVHAISLDSTPKLSGSYSRSVSGASAHSDSPLQVSSERPANADPNFQLNYKARVYLTHEQKRAYGRNILARMPSVDGSKTKYLVGSGGEGGGGLGGRASSSSLYSSDSLPRGRKHDVLQMDAELGSSQC